MMSSVNEQRPDQQAILSTNNKKKWYLLMSNPSKSTHLGTLLRCAAAFQVHQVLLVGYDKFNCQGSFGSHLFLDIVVFPSWDSVHDYLRRGGDDGGNDNAKNSKNVEMGEGQDASTNETPADEGGKSLPAKNPVPIIGILGAYGGGEEIFSPDGMPVYEDMESNVSAVPPKESAITDNLPASCLPDRSFPVNTRPFSTDVCFLLPKDTRNGIPASQARMCSGYVHVPHLSFDNEASPTLKPSQIIPKNESKPMQTSLATAAPTESPPITSSNLMDTALIISIVLHQFTAWAGYTERTFAENQKFVKDTMNPNTRRRLCRVFGQNYEKKDQSENSNKPDSNTEKEAMNAMMLWNETGDASQGSDY